MKKTTVVLIVSLTICGIEGLKIGCLGIVGEYGNWSSLKTSLENSRHYVSRYDLLKKFVEDDTILKPKVPTGYIDAMIALLNPSQGRLNNDYKWDDECWDRHKLASEMLWTYRKFADQEKDK